MMNFIKPEYLVSLYLNLNDKEKVTLKELGDYAQELNKELKERKIEVVFLISDKYIDEMLFYNKDYFEYSGTFEDVVTHYSTNWIKRIVPNDILSITFTSWLSDDVLKVANDLKLKEKKMTTEEKVKVMTAYTEGKQIQIYNFSNKTWEDINHEPVWDWDNCLYRVKPETSYRPYQNDEEMLEDIKKRAETIQHPLFSNIWLKIKHTNSKSMIIGYNATGIDLYNYNSSKASESFSWAAAYYNFTYLDGSPFGKKAN